MKLDRLKNFWSLRFIDFVQDLSKGMNLKWDFCINWEATPHKCPEWLRGPKLWRKWRSSQTNEKTRTSIYGTTERYRREQPGTTIHTSAMMNYLE